VIWEGTLNESSPPPIHLAKIELENHYHLNAILQRLYIDGGILLIPEAYIEVVFQRSCESLVIIELPLITNEIPDLIVRHSIENSILGMPSEEEVLIVLLLPIAYEK
jgi:hypothetical protein